jgi:hypothetical protein
MGTGPHTPDEVIIQQLGAAVLLCWHKLPLIAHEHILAQAEDMIGLPHIPDIRDKITGLVLRLAPRR